MAALRILFYAVDGLGLGHVSRLLAIARQVRRQRDDAQCLFLTASEAGEVIFKEGFPAFKVPSRTARVTAALEPARYARMVQTVTWNLVSAFDPHLLVVDTFPAGTLQELLPLLRWNISKVFVFREQQPRFAADTYLQEILRLYQQIIVPHTPGEFAPPLPGGVPAHWVGPILLRERHEAHSRREARAQLGLPSDGPLVLVSFGGGGDVEGRRLAAQCAALQSRFPSVGFALAPGPLWPESVPLPRLPTIHQYPLAAFLPAFDAAISASGYNTAHELLHFGVPTVYLPVVKGVDDQQARARRIAEAGGGLVLEAPSDQALADGLGRVLDPSFGRRCAERARTLVPPGGAAAAASAILALDERAQVP